MLKRLRLRLRLESDCWDWTSTVDRCGYGTLKIRIHGKRRRFTASKIAWEAVYGPIPEGMEVCHSCDNRRCCNPDHLFLGTHKQNMDDMVRKGRQLKGEGVGSAILTSQQVEWIRKVYRPGSPEFGGGVLAERLGVSRSVISDIVHGKTWKHLPLKPDRASFSQDRRERLRMAL